MCRSVRAHVKKCHKCHVNKRSKHKYGKLPPKLVVKKPWSTLCVDLIGPYTLKGKDDTVIDFMCVTMINPAFSWLEIVELSVSKLEELDITSVDHRGKKIHMFLMRCLKKPILISHLKLLALLLSNAGFAKIHHVNILYTTTVVN